MDENEFCEWLREELQEIEFSDIRTIRTYKEEDILTGNSGLVITMKSGETFQLTVVQC